MSAEVTSLAGSASAEVLHGTDTEPSPVATPQLDHIGPYRILGVLGNGGMGTVYEGLQTDIERRVAIKLLHANLAGRADAKARLHNEARIVNRVGHPGLVQISEVGRLPSGSVYLVMELLRGETLAVRMQKTGGALDLSDAVPFAEELADILIAAHKCGVIHRDLKPSNVMIVPDPQTPKGERIKLIDFGIAKVMTMGASPGLQTPQDSVLGTPDYMSPEQCAGDAVVDGSSDVYSLGAVMFHMLAGQPPFMEKTAGKVLAMHQYETARSVRELRPDTPEELSQLIGRMLAKSRDGRPSLIDVQQQLQGLASGLSDRSGVGVGIAKRPVQRPRPLAQATLGDLEQPHARKARWRLAAWTVGAVICLAIGMVWKWKPRTVAPSSVDRILRVASPQTLPLVRSESAIRKVSDDQENPIVVPSSRPVLILRNQPNRVPSGTPVKRRKLGTGLANDGIPKTPQPAAITPAGPRPRTPDDLNNPFGDWYPG